jgi:putative PIN family toxin of toxin-antitoxin system
LTELVDVLGRPRIRNKYNVQEEDVRTLIALILLRGVEVVPTRHYTICRDPKTTFLLDIAVAGSANVFVSGDDDVIALSPFQGIPVISAAAFLAMLMPSS